MATKHYWLMKSEPDVYSIDALKKDKKTYWDGVRNFKARNNMRDMKLGDGVFFYPGGIGDGRNVVVLGPPFGIGPEEIERIGATLEAVIASSPSPRKTRLPAATWPNKSSTERSSSP